MKYSPLSSTKCSSAIALLALLIACGAAFGVGIAPFTTWDDLTQKSPDIVIARCTATPNPNVVGDGMIWSKIQVITILKGETIPAVAEMVSQYWPCEGEEFLMFSTYQTNKLYRAYNATETYRVIPIIHFKLEELDGMPLTDQIRLIIISELGGMSKDLERAGEEKKRLLLKLKK